MAIVYYIFIFKVWFLSKLPMRLLYGLSPIISFFLQNIFGYRRKVILTNLHNSFPDKSEKEIKTIVKKYYRNLADIIMEVIKWRSISEKNLLKRFRFENYHLFDEAFERGQSIIVAIGHCGNWEWMGSSLASVTKNKGFAIVKPLSDKRFNTYMEKIRGRLNPDDGIIPFQQTFRQLIKNKREFQAFYVFAADQTPTKDEINYWTEFLNQETGFFLGIEKIAKALDHTVIYIDIVREKRGYYKGVLSLVTSDPKSTGEFEITESYIRTLESSIRQNPDNWLWSHRRWKHKREDMD